MNLAKRFLILSLLFGLILCFVTPPFQSPDEYNHFFRATGIANGDLIPIKILKSKVANFYKNFLGTDKEASEFHVGSYISEDLVDLAKNISSGLPGNTKAKQNIATVIERIQSKNKFETRVFVSYPNTALYSPIPYIPSSLIIAIGQLLNLNYLIIFYLARMANLVTYTFLIYLGIKNTPFLKSTLFLLALMPMSLFLGASVSTDSLVIAFSFLLFSLLSKLNKNYDGKTFKYLLLISFLLGASKSAYFLLPFSSLALCISHKKPKFLLPLLASSAGFFSWSLLSKDLYVPLRINIDPLLQADTIMQKPLEFVRVLVNTVTGYRNYIINQFVGNLGWMDVPLNIYVSYIYILLLAVSTLFEKKFLSISDRIVNFMVTGTTFLLFSTMLYLSWTPVGHAEILGLVGRYFIPISVFGLASISSIVKTKYKRALTGAILLIPIPTLIYAVYEIIKRYYLG